MMNVIISFIRTAGMNDTEEVESAKKLWRIEYPNEPFEYVLNMVRGKEAQQ